ncbi:hypothetical protein N9878_00750 [bacterium]|nr:hypothetical protein [bacterium]
MGIGGRELDQIILLSFLAMSSLLAYEWPADAFGGYSYAIDAALFVLAAYLIQKPLVVVFVLMASAYNFLTASAEVALTSNSLVLSDDAISILGLFYIHYESVMVALTVAMLIASLRHGSASSVGSDKRRDSGIRNIFKVEVSQ